MIDRYSIKGPQDRQAPFQALVQALLRPDFYPHPVDRVELIQTHISAVFLAGERAYKLKKPVNFGFLDFSSQAARQKFCREELRLNRRLAPNVYLDLARITEAGEGFELNGSGPVVDWLVVMRRMDQELLGPRLLARGLLNGRRIDALIDVLTPFYRSAASEVELDLYGRPAELREKTEGNFLIAERFAPIVLTARRLAEIRAFSDGFLETRADLFQARIDQGWIREGHGDLHLNNICFEDPPVVFDAIEFNESFRCMDTAGDLAFLAMDLEFNGRADLSQRLIDGYVAASGDKDLVRVLPFYKCYYAMVRGKIHSLAFDDPAIAGPNRGEHLALARRYFGLAHRYAEGRARPKVVVPLGLMASGKSALARWLFGKYGWPVIRSDRLRKQLAGLAEATRVENGYGQGLYSPEMTLKTYRAMFETAAGFLAAGQGVILDASFKRTEDRLQAVDLALDQGADIVFISTWCSPAEQARRLENRQFKTGPSDGRLELARDQARDFDPPGPAEEGRLITLDTSGPKAQTRALAVRELERQGFVTD